MKLSAKHSPWLIAYICTMFLSISSSINSSEARDLQGRFGLGYNAELPNTTQAGGPPGISVKYAMTRDIAVEGILSVSTGTPGNSGTGLKLFKNVFLETNLNFYTFMGGAILSANDKSGAGFLGGFGAEFFIPGIDSLGFSMETGASFDNLSGAFVLRTMGFSFLNAGMHFYF